MTTLLQSGAAVHSPMVDANRETRSYPRTFAMRAISATAFKVALILAGANTTFTGLNRALGGLVTLGWQGSTDFIQVIAEHQYLVQDNHNRFLGGVWTGIGLLLLAAPFNLRVFRPALNLVFALIFLGGLARFTAMRSDVVFGPDIVVSLVAELIGMPLLFFWLAKTLKDEAA